MVTRLPRRKPTDAAQDVFACACRQAAKHSLAVGPEHLLVAALERGEVGPKLLESYGVGAEDVLDHIAARDQEALASLGISLDSVRGEIVERFGRAAWEQPYCLPIEAETKRVLERAVRRCAGPRRRRISGDEVLQVLVDDCTPVRRLLLDLDVRPEELGQQLQFVLRR